MRVGYLEIVGGGYARLWDINTVLKYIHIPVAYP